MRQEYEMTDEQLQKLYQACQPQPAIMLQCGTPPSQQEMANDAWDALGREMGFDFMTVEPSGSGDRFFTAEPLEQKGKRK
jgi:hypothetical protein